MVSPVSAAATIDASSPVCEVSTSVTLPVGSSSGGQAGPSPSVSESVSLSVSESVSLSVSESVSLSVSDVPPDPPPSSEHPQPALAKIAANSRPVHQVSIALLPFAGFLVLNHKLVPRGKNMRAHRYRHNRTGEDNGDAHHKRQIMGREVMVAITDGRLDLGAWEQIFYAEFDGNRRKRVLVKIIGE
jgi:hypothetical protein